MKRDAVGAEDVGDGRQRGDDYSVRDTEGSTLATYSAILLGSLIALPAPARHTAGYHAIDIKRE
jgi:hypothetical protein